MPARNDFSRCSSRSRLAIPCRQCAGARSPSGSGWIPNCTRPKTPMTPSAQTQPESRRWALVVFTVGDPGLRLLQRSALPTATHLSRLVSLDASPHRPEDGAQGETGDCAVAARVSPTALQGPRIAELVPVAWAAVALTPGIGVAAAHASTTDDRNQARHSRVATFEQEADGMSEQQRRLSARLQETLPSGRAHFDFVRRIGRQPAD